MILYSQSNAWYAGKPEENLVQDITRKMALSLVLLMPNLAVLGVGVIVVLMGSWNIVAYFFAGICSILIIGCCCAHVCACCLNLIFCLITCGCCKEFEIKIPKSSILIASLLLLYIFLFGNMIWTTVEANTNPGAYYAFIIRKGHFNTMAGIILSIGFLPVILMILLLAVVTVGVVLFIVYWVCYFLLQGFLKLFPCCNFPCSKTQTTDTQWRHKSKISEKLGWYGRQNMLRPCLKSGSEFSALQWRLFPLWASVVCALSSN